MKISKIMKTELVTTGSTTSLHDALGLMRDHQIRHLPVVDDESQLIGIVSDRDLREAMVRFEDAPRSEDGRPWTPTEVPVEEVMTREPTVVTKSEDIARVARMMQSGGYGCIPIVDHGRLVGLVTTTDMLRALVAALDALRRERGSSP